MPLINEAEPLRLLLESRDAEPILSLAEVIAGRRSVRRFTPSPIPPDALEVALGAAAAFDAEQFGAAPGDPSRPVVLQPHDDQALSTGLRMGYAAAPELMLICGRVDAFGQPPTEAHRRALLRAGSFGYALWLAARAAGLEGCVYGRSSREATVYARMRLGQGFRHLFTVALGYPAEIQNPEAAS